MHPGYAPAPLPGRKIDTSIPPLFPSLHPLFSEIDRISPGDIVRVVLRPMLGKNMREHICIRNSDYVAGTAEKPEVGVFTQARKNQRPSPWGRIAEGETVWMKWSGGPIVAKAEVSGFRQISDCTPKKLKSAVSG